MSDTPIRSEPHVLFQLGDTSYSIRSRFVQQMEMIEHVTPVPNAPPFVEGVVLSRGRVIPAINLRLRFGFEKIPYDLRTRLIIVHTDGRTVGLIVDTAREFVTIPAEAIQPPPETISGLSGRFLEGVATLGNRLVLILDVNAILDLAETISRA
ncbi:MAG: chemotaxis protein CheW [Anaerolineae bacterium]